MFKVFLMLDLYTSSNSWQDVLTNKPAHGHTADFPRYLPLAKDVSRLGKGGGGLGIIFAGYVLLPLRAPTPL